MIKSAVIPVAGYGTRLLPATKSQPKEMLPVARKPIVQYVVEELVSNGIQQILFVTGRSKASIENHFDHDPDLFRTLTDRIRFLTAGGTMALPALLRAAALSGDAEVRTRARRVMDALWRRWKTQMPQG